MLSSPRRYYLPEGYSKVFDRGLGVACTQGSNPIEAAAWSAQYLGIFLFPMAAKPAGTFKAK